MIRRLLWFALGAGFAVWAAAKLRGYVRRATPQALTARVAESAGGVQESARDFVDRVRAGMVEREAELRAVLDSRGAGADRLGLHDPE